MDTAILTCPFCQHNQKVEIPQTGCLAFHKCEQCSEIISVPKESSNCCVICEYADKACPIGHKQQR